MVNVGLSWSSIVGIALAVSGAGLYFLRTFRPGLARDHDIFFAAVALLCGGILFFQGWRQDPILQFGQLMLAASAIWFAFETIRLRGITTEQAKRSTPIVDDDRPVSRVYRAELDELTPLDEQRLNSRRIRGSKEGRSSQYDDDYSSEPRRRPPSTRSLTDRSSSSYGSSSSSDRPRRSRPDSPSYSGSAYADQSPTDSYGDRSSSRSAWDDDNSYGDTPSDYRSSSSSSSRRKPSSDRIRRPRPNSRRGSSSSADYVDYQPIDYPDR
mgnify:CR=1 FL=1